MPAHTDYYNTKDTVPKDGFYASFCDNRTVQLKKNEKFPPCPACNMVASWREV
jgi:hypothetical protein